MSYAHSRGHVSYCYSEGILIIIINGNGGKLPRRVRGLSCANVSKYSRVAQWKRAGPITQRSEDRNLALLTIFFTSFYKIYLTLCYFLFYFAIIHNFTPIFRINFYTIIAKKICIVFISYMMDTSTRTD